jgi:hypothetical protein
VPVQVGTVVLRTGLHLRPRHPTGQMVHVVLHWRHGAMAA